METRAIVIEVFLTHDDETGKLTRIRGVVDQDVERFQSLAQVLGQAILPKLGLGGMVAEPPGMDLHPPQPLDATIWCPRCRAPAVVVDPEGDAKCMFCGCCFMLVDPPGPADPAPEEAP